MSIRSFSLLLLASLSFFACTAKKSAGPQTVNVAMEIDDAFNRILENFQTEGIELKDINEEDLKITTDWIDISTEELKSMTKLTQSEAFYDGGRYAFVVSMRENGNASVATGVVHLESNLRRKGGAGNVAPTGHWTKQESNGKLEKEMVEILSR